MARNNNMKYVKQLMGDFVLSLFLPSRASRIKRFAKYFEILLQLFPRKRLVTVGNKKMIWLLSDSDQHDADLM